MMTFIKNVFANIVALFLVGVGFFILLIVLISIGSSGHKASISKDGGVLVIDDKSYITDSPNENSSDIFSFGAENENILLYDLLQVIEKAKSDNRIKGISIETDFSNAGLTQLEDIRNALQDFKKSGKFVYAYGNTVSQPSYYLGSVADQYFLNPAGGIELKGMSTEVTFFKNFAEKLGVGIEVLRHGKYKAAVEPFLRDDISPENRQQLSVLLNDVWDNTAKQIAASRKIDTAQFRTIVDSLYGIIPENGVKYRLADKLAQKTEYEGAIKSKLNIKEDKKLNRISVKDYLSTIDIPNSTGQVAVLYASGTIMSGDSYDGIHSRRFVKYIREIAEDSDIKSVVVRINSPGGSANASDEILHELKRLKEKKPVIISFGDYAASGGYYMAMAGDRIFSEPNTITGSIGVFGVIPNLKGAAEKNGIRSDAVTTNANSNMISVVNGLSPGAKIMLTKNVEQTYKRFVGFVMQNRKMTYSEVDAMGGGRVWSGSRAKQIGLVDELGTLKNAIDFAAKKVNLKEYTVSTFPKKLTKFEQIMKDMGGEDDLSTRFIKSKLGENYSLFQTLTDPHLQNSIMMEMPFKLNYK